MDFPYGDEPSQFLRVHDAVSYQNDGTTVPVVVIIHGGFWKERWNVDNAMHHDLAPFFAARGAVAVELEYRRVGEQGGGFPGTNRDVLDGIAAVEAAVKKVTGRLTDKSRIILVGHSAGGCLALYAAVEAASRPDLPVPALVVALSPVTDLVDGAERRLSDEGDAIQNYMGGDPAELHVAYSNASPIARLPTTGPVIAAIGGKDDCVPPDMVRAYVEKAGGGCFPVGHLELEDEDHFSILDTSGTAWASIFALIQATAAPGTFTVPHAK